MYHFTCPRCGEEGSVPFEPSNPERILCSQCHEETGGKTFDLSKALRAPRRRHNTRVTLSIVCACCGKEAELDYMPKGVPLAEMQCHECMELEKGEETRWGIIHELKKREQRIYTPTFKLPCAACGGEVELKRKPDPEREYYCLSCLQNDCQPVGPNYREGERQEIDTNLFIRKRKDPKIDTSLKADPRFFYDDDDDDLDASPTPDESVTPSSPTNSQDHDHA